MTINELYWLAGFYEGEGSCGCYQKTCYSKTGKRYQYRHGVVKVSISQKDEKIIRWIRKLLGYGSVGHRMNRKSSFGSDVWIWEAGHNDAKKFLAMIYPHLRINRRKQQVRDALA